MPDLIAKPFTCSQVADMLGCSPTTVTAHARSGYLPGVLFGDGGYVFPAGALLKRLDEIAIEEAAERRKPVPKPSGVLQALPSKTRRSPPSLPAVAP